MNKGTFTLIFLLMSSTGLAFAQEIPPGSKQDPVPKPLLKPVLPGTFTDPRDGQVYKTVKIGNQVWMAQNLNYNAGPGSNPNNMSVPPGTPIWGRVYYWKTAMQSSPPGWHLPTEADWEQLTNYLGGNQVAGGKLKEKGTVNWRSPNEGATNESGFFALPGGYAIGLDVPAKVYYHAYFWSTGEYGDRAYGRRLNYFNSSIDRVTGEANYGFSVRCVKDN